VTTGARDDGISLRDTAGGDHLAGGGLGRGRRRGAIAAAVALAAVGAGAAVYVASGGGDGAGVVLMPATATSADDPFDDLDLMPAEQRSASVEGSTEDLAETRELDAPVELAAVAVRGTEPLVYAATNDEPACDLAPLEEAAEDDAAGELATWFELVGGDRGDARGGGAGGGTGTDRDAVDRDEILEQLTAVRLRHDTRVTAHRLDGGDAEAYPAVLQAGTAVLIDEVGVPRVRCTGGVPLSEPVAADDELDAADAVDAGAHAANADEAWAAFDPRDVVVIERGGEHDGFEVADLGGADPFTRPAGSNGDRDWREAQGLDRCDDCPTVEVTAESTAGTAAEIEAVAGGVPSSRSPGGLTWRHADPGTYGWSLSHDYVLVDSVLLAPDEMGAAPLQGTIDDPDHEGDDTFVTHVFPPTGELVAETWQCLPGDVTVTVSVAGEVVSTTTHAVPCGNDEAVSGEYVLAG
jgi:hypothetical protein